MECQQCGDNSAKSENPNRFNLSEQCSHVHSSYRFLVRVLYPRGFPRIRDCPRHLTKCRLLVLEAFHSVGNACVSGEQLVGKFLHLRRKPE